MSCRLIPLKVCVFVCVNKYPSKSKQCVVWVYTSLCADLMLCFWTFNYLAKGLWVVENSNFNYLHNHLRNLFLFFQTQNKASSFSTICPFYMKTRKCWNFKELIPVSKIPVSSNKSVSIIQMLVLGVWIHLFVLYQLFLHLENNVSLTLKKWHTWNLPV